MSEPVLIRAERALLGSVLVPEQDLLLAGGAVQAIGPWGSLAADAPSYGCAVAAPGFVDLHVHALDGRGMVGEASPDVSGLGLALAARGVTSFLATTVAAPIPELVAALRHVATTQSAGARCLGAHLEGPWLSAQHAGAQPLSALAAPSVADLEALLAAGPLLLLTLAPELTGADAVIRAATAAGTVVSMGHSGATYTQARDAVAAGVRHVTHCFNAMSGLDHREPGVVGAAFDLGSLSVEVIADGEHVHPAAVRALWRTAGRDRVCLVSDAVDIALPGAHAARLPDGTLAGSRIGLDAAVRNVVSWGVPLEDALLMASVTPAQVLSRTVALGVGAVADLVLLDLDLEPTATLVAGELVWRA